MEMISLCMKKIKKQYKIEGITGGQEEWDQIGLNCCVRNME